MIGRMYRAARLEPGLYEEVEHDRGATPQAMAIVLISSVAAGVGALTEGGATGLLLGSVWALITWIIWSFITYFLGTRVLPSAQTEASYGQLLRTIGFSSSPGIIRVLGLVPALFAVVNVVASIWMLIAMVVAVRQALDYTSTWRAVAVVGIGWAIQLVLFFVLVGLVGLGTS